MEKYDHIHDDDEIWQPLFSMKVRGEKLLLVTF